MQLFWGYGLRSLWKAGDDTSDFYITCYKTFMQSLEKADSVQFSEKLEELMIHEFRFTISRMVKLGMHEAERLLIPDLI